MCEIGLKMIEIKEVQLSTQSYDLLKSSVEVTMRCGDANIWKIVQGSQVRTKYGNRFYKQFIRSTVNL